METLSTPSALSSCAARPTLATKPALSALLAAAAVMCAGHASAATIFNDTDGANSFISTPGNWDNGLPTGANQGTININAQYDSAVTHSGYNVLHTGGNISRGNSFMSFAMGTGTTWVMDGAAAAITQARGINLGAGSTFTLNEGNANLTDNNRDTRVVGAGAAISVNGGSLSIGRDLLVYNGGSFEVNGGVVTGIDQFLSPGFASSTGAHLFNGGSTSADNFQFDTAGTATFGGTTAGSLELLVGLGNGVTLDWLDGSLMELTIANADQAFYENLFANGGLLFEGSNGAAFGDNFQVSGSTLSLIQQNNTVIPEPGAVTVGLCLGGLSLLRRRRRSA